MYTGELIGKVSSDSTLNATLTAEQTLKGSLKASPSVELAGTLTNEVVLNGKVTPGRTLKGKMNIGGFEVSSENIVTRETVSDFPVLGSTKKAYICIVENAIYRWDEELQRYYCIGRDYDEIPLASVDIKGLMSSADKRKLDELEDDMAITNTEILSIVGGL